MKNVWITLLCFLPLAAFAQKDQGRIVYLETINMKIELSPEMQQYAHLIPTEQKSKMDLYFNAHESLYTQNTDPVETEENPFDEGNAVTIRIGMGEGSQIYQNRETGQLLKAENLMGKEFLIVGELEKPEWKILGNQKQILGYNCIEATTESDSTTIHAWFAPQIPISVGPGEITGLPGAILSANFKNGDQSVLIEAQQLEFEAVSDKIVQPEKGKKVNQEEFEEIVRKRMEEMEKMYGGDSESSGDGNVRIKVIRE